MTLSRGTEGRSSSSHGKVVNGADAIANSLANLLEVGAARVCYVRLQHCHLIS
jgi:hypothetical protein